jgi:hypothetical protein
MHANQSSWTTRRHKRLQRGPHVRSGIAPVVLGDALYLQAPFVKAVQDPGMAWAFTLKKNQPELLREAERLPPARGPVEP